tara:strand:+ start:2427 stop:4304 length:1878 start_codon:yes stop_codon:yes gene_type:complete
MATKKVNIDIIAKDKSKQALRGVQGNLDGVKKSIFNVRNALVGLGAGLAIKSFIDVGKQVESLQVRLKFLFGSVEEGAKAFDEMSKFASEVPFSLGEIQKGAGVLAVVSDDANELAKNMRLTGNVAAVTGLDFKTTAEQIQRSLSAGISAADLFRDRGVKSMLGFKAGATVSIEETAEALERVFGAGGQFDGATKSLANTLEGTLSMIGDKYFNFQKTIAQEFFVGLKKEFGALDVALAQNEKIITNLATSIGIGLSNAITTTAKAFKIIHDNIVLIKKIGFALIIFGMTKAFIGLALAIRRAGLAMIAFTKVSMKNLAGLLAAGAVLIADYTGHLDKLLEKFTAKKTLEEFSEEVEIVADSLRLLEVATFKIGSPFNKLQNEAVKLIQQLENMREETEKGTIEFENITLMIDDLSSALHDVPLELIIIEDNINKTKKELSKFAELTISFKKGFTSTFEDAKNLTLQFEEVGKKAFKSFDSELKNALKNGKFRFKEFRESIMIDLSAILIKQQLIVAAQSAMGMLKNTSIFGSVKKILGFQHGGIAQGNTPAIVGENGPELIIPKTTSQIIPNQNIGNFQQPVNVNFNISTVDASGFNQLLTNSRGVIVNMINSAVNETGRQAIV